MDVREIEAKVDRDIADMRTRAANRPELRRKRRTVWLFTLAFVLMFALAQLVSLYVLGKLLIENRVSGRLTSTSVLLEPDSKVYQAYQYLASRRVRIRRLAI